jgi:ABC-type nickel/cobalt efflux system permease component RcnA
MTFVALVLGGIMSIVVAFCYVLLIAFTVWMAVDAAKQDRFWWLTVVIGVPVIGPAAYYFTEKKHEYARAPIHHLHTSETEEQHEKAPKKRKHTKKSEEKKEEQAPQAQEEKKTEVEEGVQAQEEKKEEDLTLEELVEGEEKPSSS